MSSLHSSNDGEWNRTELEWNRTDLEWNRTELEWKGMEWNRTELESTLPILEIQQLSATFHELMNSTIFRLKYCGEKAHSSSLSLTTYLVGKK